MRVALSAPVSPADGPLTVNITDFPSLSFHSPRSSLGCLRNSPLINRFGRNAASQDGNAGLVSPGFCHRN